MEAALAEAEAAEAEEAEEAAAAGASAAEAAAAEGAVAAEGAAGAIAWGREDSGGLLSAAPSPRAVASPPAAPPAARSPPRPSSRYLRLSEAELDQGVLAELPEALRREVESEVAHADLAQRRRAEERGGQRERRRPACAPAAAKQPKRQRLLSSFVKPEGAERSQSSREGEPDAPVVALLEMGFAEGDVRAALRMAGNDRERAVEALLAGGTGR